jgi:carbonic anhydrase
MVITCADSRILLDPLVNSEPGIVFAVRNVGNLVPNDDSDHSVSAAVEYAITALHVPDIIVMGHAECGAMKALLGPKLEGTVGEWLKYGEDSLDHMKDGHTIEGIPDYDQLSKQNVITQAERLRAMPVIQNAGTQVHAWWWDMANARVLAYDGNGFASIEEVYSGTQSGTAVLR